eukprot:UN03376
MSNTKDILKWDESEFLQQYAHDSETELTEWTFVTTEDNHITDRYICQIIEEIESLFQLSESNNKGNTETNNSLITFYKKYAVASEIDMIALNIFLFADESWTVPYHKCHEETETVKPLINSIIYYKNASISTLTSGPMAGLSSFAFGFVGAAATTVLIPYWLFTGYNPEYLDAPIPLIPAPVWGFGLFFNVGANVHSFFDKNKALKKWNYYKDKYEENKKWNCNV